MCFVVRADRKGMYSRIVKSQVIDIEGISVEIELTSHARSRINLRDISWYAVQASVLSVGEALLEYKDGDEIMIIDEDNQVGVQCQLQTEGVDIFITIVTVIYGDDIWTKKGTKTVRYSSK